MSSDRNVEGVRASEPIAVDFGKERREASRILARLLGIIEAQEAELLADPLRLFKLATNEIGRLQRVLHDARGALAPSFSFGLAEDAARPSFDVIRVPRDEWDRLRACAAVIRRIDSTMEGDDGRDE